MANINLSEDERNKIAIKLIDEIQQFKAAVSRVSKTWDAHEDLFQANLRGASLSVMKGMNGYNVPLIRQIVNRTVNTVYAAIFTQRPAVQCIQIGAGDTQGKNSDKMERTLANLAEKAGLELPFKKSVRQSCITNLGTVCIRPTVDSEGYVTGLKATAHHPKRVMAYPVESESYADCQTWGYMDLEMVRRVRKLQKDGVYYDYDQKIVGGAQPDDTTPGSGSSSVNHVTTDVPSDMVERWTLISELDLNQFRDKDPEDPNDTDGEDYKKYQITLDVTNSKLLSCELYGMSDDEGAFEEYDHVNAVEIKVLPEEEDGIISRYSFVYSLAGIEEIRRDLFTTMAQGSLMASFGVVVIVGGTQKKWENLQPGQVLIEPQNTAKVEHLKFQFDAGRIPEAIDRLKGIADEISGFPNLAMGQQLETKRTATEIDVIADSIGEMKDEKVLALAEPVARLYEIILMYLRLHYKDLKRAYGELIEVTEEEAKNMNIRLEVTGKTGSATPGQTLKKLGMLRGMAMENQNSNLDPSKIEDAMAENIDLNVSLESISKSQAEVIAGALGLQPQEIKGAEALNEMSDAGGNQAGTQGGGMGDQPQILGDTAGSDNEGY